MERERLPTVLITDPGRDIDDTLAFHVLNSATDLIEIVAVICSGGNSSLRKNLARDWMIRMNWPRKIALVDTPSAPQNPKTLGCFQPNKFYSTDQQDFGADLDAPHLLLDLCNKYNGELIVICMAPITALAEAVKLDQELMRRSISRIYIQGQALIDSNGNITPDLAAFNLREDKESSEIVFEKLLPYVDCTFLGKWAAYRVTLTPLDLNLHLRSPFYTRLSEEVFGCLDVFRRGDPDLFYKLYPVEEKYRNDTEWKEHLPYVSHPYDPLLCLTLLDMSVFNPKRMVNPQGKEYLLIGMKEEEDGIPDSESAKKSLVSQLHNSFQKCGLNR